MFSSGFRRALTMAIHSSSSTDTSDCSTADHSGDHSTETVVPGRALIDKLPSDEEGGAGISGISGKLGSVNTVTFQCKTLPSLPLGWDAGTSSALTHGYTYPPTSIVTETLTVEHGILSPNSNDTRTATISVSISQMQDLPTDNIDAGLPPPYSNVNNQTSDTVLNEFSPRSAEVVVEAQLLENSPTETPLTTSSPPVTHTHSDSNTSHTDSQTTENKEPISDARLRTRKSTSSFPSFLHKLAVNNTLPPAEHDDEERTRRRKRTHNTFPSLQPIVETNSADSSMSTSSSASPLTSNIRGLDTSFARKMEEAGRLRRLQSKSGLKSDARESTSSPDSRVSSQDPSIEPQAHLKSYSEDDAKAEGRILRDLLDRTLRELNDTREEAARVTAQLTWEKSRLVQELKSSNEDVLNLRKESEAQRYTITTLRSQLKKSEVDLNALKKEKRTWQDQLDTMHHKIIQSERRIRCLDNLTHSKLDARMEGAFGPTRRSTKATVAKDASAEVVGSVEALNEEILQTSNLLVENLERTYGTGSSANVSRAKVVVGDDITRMMQTQRTSQTTGFRLLLMQAALEAFMVHWSTYIIEGWYPKQQSFADLLIDISSQASKVNTSIPSAKVECGRVRILETTSSMTDKFPGWVSDIIVDLGKVLSTGGLRVRPNRSDLLKSKLLIIVKMAYDVRTALAEKDICGGIDLVVIGSDMPFQEKWMDEAHHDAMNRTRSSTTTGTVELVACTCGLGLQRLPADMHGKASKSTPTMVLKPKVVLARVLEESP